MFNIKKCVLFKFAALVYDYSITLFIFYCFERGLSALSPWTVSWILSTTQQKTINKFLSIWWQLPFEVCVHTIRHAKEERSRKAPRHQVWAFFCCCYFLASFFILSTTLISLQSPLIVHKLCITVSYGEFVFNRGISYKALALEKSQCYLYYIELQHRRLFLYYNLVVAPTIWLSK